MTIAPRPPARRACGERIRVLVVDDSAVIRRLVVSALTDDPSCEVVGTANNGKDALDRIAALRPDIVTLDIEMPVMNGLEALIAIRRTDPRLPVIMFSTLTERGAHATFEALRRGASDYATKPSAANLDAGRRAVRDELVPKIRALTGWVDTAQPAASPAVRPIARPAIRARRTDIDALVVGVSTGGPTALTSVWRDLPRTLRVPILVVQHMPPLFTAQLAKQLDAVGTVPACEAADGQIVEPGRAYIAPGGRHMTVVAQGLQRIVRLGDGPPENSCRPAVDVLFRSAAATYGSRLLAVVLTGMGYDGLLGTRDIVAAGGAAIAQDEATSVVWGMPRAIADAGLADVVLPLHKIPAEIVARLEAPRAVAIAGRS